MYGRFILNINVLLKNTNNNPKIISAKLHLKSFVNQNTSKLINKHDSLNYSPCMFHTFNSNVNIHYLYLIIHHIQMFNMIMLNI